MCSVQQLEEVAATQEVAAIQEVADILVPRQSTVWFGVTAPLSKHVPTSPILAYTSMRLFKYWTHAEVAAALSSPYSAGRAVSVARYI